MIRQNPYLSFRDTARDAMDFYHSVLGGELALNTFGEYGMSDDPAERDKVMHSMLTIDDGLTLMAADTPNSMELTTANAAVSLSGDDESTLRRWWDGLSDGATVTAPLARAPWGDTFGMCVDRFGVTWMVNIAGPPAAG